MRTHVRECEVLFFVDVDEKTWTPKQAVNIAPAIGGLAGVIEYDPWHRDGKPMVKVRYLGIPHLHEMDHTRYQIDAIFDKECDDGYR